MDTKKKNSDDKSAYYTYVKKHGDGRYGALVPFTLYSFGLHVTVERLSARTIRILKTRANKLRNANT